MIEKNNSVIIIKRAYQLGITLFKVPIYFSDFAKIPIDIKIDDENIGYIWNGETRYFRINDGKHTLKILGNSMIFNIDVKECIEFSFFLNYTFFSLIFNLFLLKKNRIILNITKRINNINLDLFPFSEKYDIDNRIYKEE